MKKKVMYSVKYLANTKANSNGIFGIDIPEGGDNNSKYVMDSFSYIKTKGKKVIYSAQFIAECEVAEGETLEDAAFEIDIPEGGKNNSEYVEDSFELVGEAV